MSYTLQGPFSTGGTCTAANLTAIDAGVGNVNGRVTTLEAKSTILTGTHNGVTFTLSAGTGAPGTLAANEIYIQLS